MIGAVGVAGGGGAAQDEACAEQGVQKVYHRSKNMKNSLLPV